MGGLELLPTEENLVKALKDDLLKRNKDLVYFYDLLSAQETSGSIALDGRWGSGKTFFIKQTEMLINAQNKMSNMDNDKRNSIINAVYKKKRMEDIPEKFDLAIYYDAWENDNDTDPIISLVYEITKQLGITYDFSEKKDMFQLAGSILELFTGRNIEAVIRSLKSDNPFIELEKEKNLEKNIEDFFTEILVERGNRLIIFVDELDRCKPSYAVQLLERVKHYLCDDRISFVFAVNLEELQHTIKHFYGETFDACRYLDRFFNMRISLPPADKSRFYQSIGLESGYVLEDVCKRIIETYNMELRELSRFYYQIKLAVYNPTHDKGKWNFIFPDEKGKQLILLYIVPILVGLKIVDITLYNEFVDGKNAQPLIDIYLDSEIGERLVRGLSVDNEVIEKSDVKQKLQELYEAIFKTEYTNNSYETTIGDYAFDCNSKAFAKTTASMLSVYADFQT